MAHKKGPIFAHITVVSLPVKFNIYIISILSKEIGNWLIGLFYYLATLPLMFDALHIVVYSRISDSNRINKQPKIG